MTGTKMDDAVSAQEATGSDTFARFVKQFEPHEAPHIALLTDFRTGATYCECHVRASKVISLGTVDVPLDPDEQSDYRANRSIVENAPAYAIMIDDAKKRRTFSNIVAEYNVDFDHSHPLKIIGGQHRFSAIRSASDEGIDELHGIKVYFDLNMEQRLDVQLISNTSIAISTDLFDRMSETVMGPQLRNWCQSVGLLDVGQDFADKRTRSGPISVQLARTFITNFFKGKIIDAKNFETIETTPDLSPTGSSDIEWEKLRSAKKEKLWSDENLLKAGKEFARLIAAQRAAFPKNGKKKSPPDYPDKATNPAILAAWSYVAGMLQSNDVRLDRHYALTNQSGRDPLNVAALVKGRHKSDPEQYRGLGYRTDPKERGRFTELFFLQAENGEGITKPNIDIAIAKYHAKVAVLEVEKIKSKA